MTIARTGNKIVDDIARAKSRALAAEERAKAEAKKSSRGGRAGGKARMAKVSAGRAAARSSRGRGIVGKVQKSGGGIKGILAYALGKKEASLIASNAGTTKAEIYRDIKACADLRPAVKNKIGHITFSLPPKTKIDNKKWQAIVDLARGEIGLDDSFSFVSVRHQDREHDHVHIIFSRVSDEGKIFDDYRLGLRLAAAEDLIEDRFGLPLIPKPTSPRPQFKDGEIEKAIRTGVQPERMQLFQIVHAAAEGSPSVVQFIQKCAAQGVVVRPNLATTGRLNGFSFSLQNGKIEFKGSQLKASWGELQKRGVTYEQDRDFTELATLADAVGGGVRVAEARDRRAGTDGNRIVEVKKPEAGRDDHARAQDHHIERPADRPVNERTAKAEEPRPLGPAMRRYLDRIAADTERRQRLADLIAQLKTDPRPAAGRLAELIAISKTDRQIAAEFIAGEKCSAEAREIVKLLNLPRQEEAAILAPYRQQIEIESYNRKRMHDAEKHAPTPDNNPADLPTF